MAQQPVTFSIEYPLFALRRPAGYVGYEMSPSRPGTPGIGVVVFTSEANAQCFLGQTGIEAEVVLFDRVAVFRKFLRGLRDRDKGATILFDLLPDDSGNLHTDSAYPASVVLERFLPEPGFLWGYPVFLLRSNSDYALINFETSPGKCTTFVAAFTDIDLAERAAAKWETAELPSPPLVPVPIESNKAFAAWLRAHPGIAGAAFDPPVPPRGGVVRTCLPRDRLLATLEIEICRLSLPGCSSLACKSACWTTTRAAFTTRT